MGRLAIEAQRDELARRRAQPIYCRLPDGRFVQCS
jgi:hypothetical protein